MDGKSIRNHIYIIADNEEEARAKFLKYKDRGSSGYDAYEILEIKPVYKVIYALKEGGED